MAKIRRITDFNGDTFYPQTHKNAVLTGKDQTLDTSLNEISSRLAALEEAAFPITCKLFLFSSANPTELSSIAYEYMGSSASPNTGRLSFSITQKGTTYKLGDNNRNFLKGLIDKVELVLTDNKTLNLSHENLGLNNTNVNSINWWHDVNYLTYSLSTTNYDYSSTIKLKVYIKGRTTPIESTVTIKKLAPIFIGLCGSFKEDTSNSTMPDSKIIPELLENSKGNVMAKKIVSKTFSTSYEFNVTNAEKQSRFWMAIPSNWNWPKDLILGGMSFTVYRDVDNIGGFAKNNDKSQAYAKFRGIEYKLQRNVAPEDKPFQVGDNIKLTITY